MGKRLFLFVPRPVFSRSRLDLRRCCLAKASVLLPTTLLFFLSPPESRCIEAAFPNQVPYPLKIFGEKGISAVSLVALIVLFNSMEIHRIGYNRNFNDS